MDTVYVVIVIVFVVAVLAAVGYALYEMSPWGKHNEHFRDRSGKRLGSGPRLD